MSLTRQARNEDPDRYRLLGNYRTPKVCIGSRVACAARGRAVIVTGYSTAPIPWPVGRIQATLDYVRALGEAWRAASTLSAFAALLVHFESQGEHAAGPTL